MGIAVKTFRGRDPQGRGRIYARTFIRIAWPAVAWLAMLGGCGGGSDPSIPARAGAADIDASGGAVDAVLEGGATVTLTVPPGALSGKTTFHLDPVAAPAGALGAMQVSPAGLRFRTPATLVVTLPSSGAAAATTSIAMAIGATLVPLGAPLDSTSRRFTMDLSALGTGTAEPFATGAAAVAGASRKRVASLAVDAVAIVLTTFSYDDIVAVMQRLVAQLGSDGSRDNAIIVGTMMDGVLRLPQANADPRVRAAVATWRSVVCGQQQFAVSALNTFDVASDYEGFLRRAGDALIFGQLAEELGVDVALLSNPGEPGCSNLPASFGQPVRDRFPAFLAAARQALGLLDPTGDFQQLLTLRIPELLDFVASLEAFSGLDDQAASVTALLADQTVRLRSGAYVACRSGHVQEPQRELLVVEAGDPVFAPVSPYDAEDLLSDIQNCGMPIHWALLAADSSVIGQGDAGGIAAGSIANAVPISLSGAAKLVLSGPLSALRCPSGSQNNEQLIFSAGPTNATSSVVGQLTPSNDSGYLEASNLEIPVSQLLALALPSGPSGSGQLLIARQGGLCNGEFPNLVQHATLVTFAINAGNLQITTTNLPPATVGTAFSVTLAVAGGVPPMVWSATRLPAGLGIDPQSGVISGTPASVGTVQVVVSVNDRDSDVAHETLSLDVRPTTVPAGRWNLTIHVDSGGAPGEPQLIAGTFLNQVSGQMGGTFSANFIADGFVNTLTPISGTLTATVGTDALGDPALIAVSITPLIDRMALRQANCQDVVVQIPGPVSENLRTLQFQTQDPSTGTDVVQISSQCGPFKYTGFDLTFSSP